VNLAAGARELATRKGKGQPFKRKKGSDPPVPNQRAKGKKLGTDSLSTQAPNRQGPADGVLEGSASDADLIRLPVATPLGTDRQPKRKTPT